MSRTCPSCSATVSPRSRFCPACGKDLPPAPETESATHPSQGSSPPPETVATQVSRPSGSGDSAPAAATASLRSVGAVSSSSASNPPSAPPAPPPPAVAPAAPDPTPAYPAAMFRRSRAPFGPELCPIEVSLNFCHVLVAGHATTVELKVALGDPTPVENLRLDFESRCFQGILSANWRRLAPGPGAKKMLEIEPLRPGNFLLQVSAVWESAGAQFSYRGQRSLKVLQAPDTGNIQISFGDLQSNAGTGANQGLGADYGDININNLLGGLKTLNDLLELELPEKFQPVPLELDYEVSRTAVDVSARRAGESLRIPPSLAATVAPATACNFELVNGTAPLLPFRLVARPQFRIGRARGEADFVAWVLPRNEANDERSKRVSKIHVIAEVAGDGILVRDNESANGSVLDGHPLDPVGVKAGQRDRLVLGAAVEIELARFAPAREGEPPIANLRAWSGPAFPAPAVRGALRCEVIADAPQPLNSLWLFTDAAFGTSRSNPLALDDLQLAEIQGRFYHYRGCFWIETLADNSAVQLDRLTLRPGEIAPLATGQQLRLGSRTWRVKLEA